MASEAMVFTIADGPAKAAFSGDGQQIGNGAGETAEGLIRKILNENMPHANVVRPDDRQFVSAMPEAHRKGEKAYHVKAFRGSKEAMLSPYLSSSGDRCELWIYLAHTPILILYQAIFSYFPLVSCLHSRNRFCSSRSLPLTRFHIHPFYSEPSI